MAAVVATAAELVISVLPLLNHERSAPGCSVVALGGRCGSRGDCLLDLEPD